MQRLHHCSNNSKDLWEVLGSLILGWKKESPDVSLGGSTNPTDVAEFLNSYFVNVGSNLANKIPARNSNIIPEIYTNSYFNGF